MPFKNVQASASQQLAPSCACIQRTLAQETHNVKLGVRYGSSFIQLLAAKVWALPFMAGSEMPFRVPGFSSRPSYDLLSSRRCRRRRTYSVEPGVTYGSTFMELPAATVLTVPFMLGRELPCRMV